MIEAERQTVAGEEVIMSGSVPCQEVLWCWHTERVVNSGHRVRVKEILVSIQICVTV